MKSRLALLGALALVLSVPISQAESEYDIRARRISEQLSPAYRSPDTTAAATSRPEIEEVVYSDYAPASSLDLGAFRFAIGTRILHVVLLNDTQGRPEQNSFIGTIYKIDANQDYLPLRPYAQITAQAGLLDIGLGLGYDHLEVATVDNGTGDGDIEMKGWLIYLVAAYPNETRFTPFGEIGVASYHNSFDPIASWSDDGVRRFSLDDSRDLYLAAGCDVQISDALSANLYVRYVDVDVDGRYYFSLDSRAYNPDPFTFTLEHLACGVGVKYVF